jgi:hypothetical protein
VKVQIKRTTFNKKSFVPTIRTLVIEKIYAPVVPDIGVTAVTIFRRRKT